MDRQSFELAVNDVTATLFTGPAVYKLLAVLAIFGLGMCAAQFLGALGSAVLYWVASAFLFGWIFAEVEL